MTIAAQNVVGGLLHDSAAYWRVADIVCTEDFPPEFRALYARIGEAARAGEAYDAVTAWDDGFENAIDLAGAVASTANIEAWAKRVADASETGRIREAGRRIALCDTYVEAQALLADVRPEQAAQVKTVQDGLTEFVETLQAR
jgi:replicative DNA helicase